MANEYKEWVSIAESDLMAARVLYEDKKIISAISIYHSHQCVEKLFKAVLIKNSQAIAKVHNLNYLFKVAINYIPELKDYEDDCTILNGYLPQLRYPTGDRIKKTEAWSCYQIANKILIFLKPLLD